MDRREKKSSREDYLEAILIRTNRYGACRVTDVADQMGYSKASVSVALKKLEEDGCIIRDEWRVVLTDKGKDIAQSIYDRHEFFSEWLKRIGVSGETAEEDACRIEHVLSEESYEKMQEYLESVEGVSYS
ncbi:MAG: MarR family transcriptional regulator [Lachnobacterium sp.]|nr:MarR family transcriptional regulator [Lachnobacterium sp.]